MAGDNGLFPYKPSVPATIVAAGLFGVSAIYHLIQMIRKKAWFYSPLTIGAIMMTFGYIFRYISSQNPTKLMPYIGQSLFIILPPSLYAATIYMIYGRLVLFVDAPEASIVRPTRVTKIFVCGDVLAFLLQAGGGGMMAQAERADMGQKIILFGLFVQLLFFGLFLIFSLIFWKRMRKSPTRYSIPQYGRYSWTALLKLMLLAAVIIILRCVFRVIEFAQGHGGYLISHEVYIYIFDAAPMLIVQAMFHFCYAADIFGAGGMAKLPYSESSIHLNER